MAKYLAGDSAKAITGQFIEVDDELNEESGNLITNSAIAEVISTLQNRISVLESASMPINSFYTQYPHETDDGTYVGFRDEDKPENLFGGKWRELFKNKGVFFRTEGGQAENKTRPPGANTTPVGRTNGIQEYAIKNIKDLLNVFNRQIQWVKQAHSPLAFLEALDIPAPAEIGMPLHSTRRSL